MKSVDRRAVRAEYKERKTAAGVFAIHCQSDSSIWIGQASNLETFENRHWFTLRQGGHPNHALQAVWNAHGDDAFSIEILEQLDDDISDISRPRVLKERQAHWVKELSASKL
jgi:hypothetical protein